MPSMRPRFSSSVIDLIQIGVIVTAFYFVGGYDTAVEKLSLVYAAEHIFVVIAAAVVSALLIYSAATFDQTMKPSRGVLLLSFVIFLPISLFYRRWIRQYVVDSSVNEAFLVMGSGPMAARFYEVYKNSPNGQRLRFLELSNERVGEPIAGEGSPTVQGDVASRLNQLGKNYSGIILRRESQFAGYRVAGTPCPRAVWSDAGLHTLESFYETHWRYLPLDIVDPVWPLQTGFQLARSSPYHYLKRLFDVVASAVALIICGPLFALIALVIWIGDGRPIFFQQERLGRDRKLFTLFKFRTMRSPFDPQMKISTHAKAIPVLPLSAGICEGCGLMSCRSFGMFSRVISA